ncbi:MAG TPA: hypothetical protein EYP55_02045 [Anaerolineae bacterium]|nr:hypothetical protein [Anaerolineae bacterium]
MSVIRNALAFSMIVLLTALLSGSSLNGVETSIQPEEFLRQVVIYRDTYGVPHVFGQTEEAAFFGDGYAQAQERLQELVWSALSARGRLSEVFGEQHLGKDYRSRLFRNYQAAEEKYPTLPPEVRRAIEAFVQGVNYYIEEHRAELPAWTPTLTPVDIVAIYRLSALNLALKGSGSEAAASNSWVLSPEKTASGRVVLVADPHGTWTQRREIHIKVKGGDLNVAGDMMHMLVWIGHNGYVAWGGSANRPDLVDVYEEKLNPQNPYEYLYEGEWRPMRVVKEKIPVRRGSQIVEVERELLYTHHGPVIELDRARNRAYAVKTPFFESAEMVTAHYRVAKAKSIEELKAALATLELPNAPNVVAGDREGNIFYVYYGKVPIRSEEYDWTKPVPGWTRETEWRGFIPFEELPQVENPTSGFLQTSNEAPWLVTPDSGLSDDPEDYPEYLVPRRLGATQRGRRLTELLTSKERFELEELKRFAFDTYIGMAAPLKELIFAGYEEHKDELGPLAEPTAQAVEILRPWDDVSRVESKAMTLFKVWYKRYRELGGSIGVGRRQEPTPSVEERRRAFQALKGTVEFMLEQYGTVEVPWGEVHVLKRGERLYTMGAADWEFQTVHMASATAIGSGQERYQDGIWYTHAGSSYMFLVELGDPVRAWSVKPFGQSGDPASPHFADQTELFSRREMKPLWFSEEEVLSNLESAWGLRIKLGTQALGYEAQLRFERPQEVRPRLAEEAPAPLPSGWKAVSPFLTLEPASAGVQGELKFYLPPEVGDAEVAVFRLSDGSWQQLETERSGGFVSAEIEALGTYVALAREEAATAEPHPEVPTAEEIFGWIQDLWRLGAEGQYGYRMPGTPADHQAADYIEGKFREFGLQTHREAVTVPVSFPERWSLTVRVEEREESIPSHFVRYAGFTPPEGLVAEMVYVGEGSEADFAEEDAAVGIEGKIVVVDVIAPGWPMSAFLTDALFVYDPGDTFAGDKATENWPPVNLDESYALAKRDGAAGYVGILTFTVRDNSQFLHWYADGAMPMLFVSPEGGARLKSLLAAGPAEARMVLTGTAGEGVIYNVYGILPGQSDEITVVHTHYDGWATNEASGTAVVMALAEYFAQFPQESRQRTLLFVAFASHFGRKPWGGGWGTYRGFLYEQLPKVVAAISVEMIGKQFKVIEGEYVDMGRIAPVHFGVRGGDRLLSFLREAILAHDLQRSVVTPRLFGEGGKYARSGIPTIERISHNAPQFTNDDTPDTVMVEVLRPTVEAFIDIINRIDATPAGLLK